jgi:hypothetical protein
MVLSEAIVGPKSLDDLTRGGWHIGCIRSR